jgi:cytochrome c peroxidase
VDSIAAYERTLITNDTPYDRFVNGDKNAMTQQQIRGMSLFESMGCVMCHYGPNFSAASVFNTTAPFRVFPAIPTPIENEYDLLTEKADTGNSSRSAWRVPSLRNVALTGPWLHNGSIDQLADVVRIMAASQLGWSGHYLQWSDKPKSLEEINRPIPTEQQINDIVAFLHALSSDKLVNNEM